MTKYIRETEVDLMNEIKELKETNKLCGGQLAELIKSSNNRVEELNARDREILRLNSTINTLIRESQEEN